MSDRCEHISYEFGRYHVDTLTRHLTRDGRNIPLTSKAFETLVVLIRQRGETVNKAELMDSVWGDTAVEENNLTQQISALRKAFGEGPHEHKFIVTVPGRGYSFIAPVTEVEGERQAPAAAVHQPLYASGRHLALVAALIVFTAASLWFVGARFPWSRQAPQTIAVLPFRSDDGLDDAFRGGIRYTLTAKLGNLQELLNVRPVAVTDSQPIQDPLVAGRELNVDKVVDGTIQHHGDQIRVTVQIVDVADRRVARGWTFDTAAADFSAQDHIAAEVIKGLQEYYARD